MSSLSKEELERFDQFLSSPYFNNWNALKTIFQNLKPFYPDFDSPQLTREFLYSRSFPGKEYNDNTLRSRLSDLEHKAKTFLAVERALSTEKNYLLLEAGIEKGLPELFENSYEKCIVDLKSRRAEDNFDFYKEYLLESSRYNFVNLHRDQSKRKSNDLRKAIFRKSVLSLFNSFFTEIINLSVHEERENELSKSIVDDALIKNALKEINLLKLLRIIQKDNESGYVLELYISLYKLTAFRKTTSNYFKYKKLIKKNKSRLNPDELSFHYSNLVSYCVEKGSFENIIEFRKELFSVYKELLEFKYYRSSKIGYVRPTLYRNILLAALRIGQFKWVQDFINNSQRYLKKEDVRNMKIFGYAYYYFELGDHAKALENMSKVEVEDFIFVYDIKNLKVRSFYETGSFEEALSTIVSYRSFLRKNLLVSDLNRKRYLEFLKYIEKIILSFVKPRIDLEYLQKQIIENENVVYKPWLISKISALIKSPEKAI